MKTLFDVLDGIIESGYEQENLANADAVIAYAEAAGITVNNDQAESIMRVRAHWLAQQENGNGEWSRMREEAKSALTCYLHETSGDVATSEMWESDFNSMDIESWFGLPADRCEHLHWLIDSPWLIEAEWIAGEWVEAQ